MRASVLHAQLPDDPAVLKALLLAQQRAFETQLAAQTAAQFERLRLKQEAAIKAREAELQKVFHTCEVELQKAFDAREAELQKAFEARILELYEQLRLARRRMFGPSSESHAGQGWLFDEAEALAASATEAGDTATLPPQASEPSGQTPVDAKKKARGKRKPLPIELPRIDVIHDVPEAERTCACGTPMVEIG